MKAGLVTGHRRFELVEVPTPTAAPGLAVLDIAYCGVCGTDVHGLLSHDPYNPAICGHEWVGTVSAVGDGVANVTEGERVVAAVLEPCGACSACSAGRGQYCIPKMVSMVGRDALGQAHGGFAAQLAFDARRLMAAPPSLTDIQAGIVEPTTVALHAVLRSPAEPDETVIVQGCGPIGLLVIQCLRAYGAQRVIGVEPAASRRALAIDSGAHEAMTPGDAKERFGRTGADIVFECAGVAATVQSAADLTRQGGVINLVGLASGDATITPGTWLRKEITMLGSLGYDRHEFAQAMDLIADGMPVERIHDTTVGLDGLADAISRLADDSTSATKLLVDPRL